MIKLAAVAGVALLGLAAACAGDATGPLTPADVVGTYALASINGTTLPAPYGQETAIIYDTLIVARDSTIVERDGAGALGSRVVTNSGTYTGHWALDAVGGQLRVTYETDHGVGLTSAFAVVDRGASLTLDVAGFKNPPLPGGGRWVYTRVR